MSFAAYMLAIEGHDLLATHAPCKETLFDSPSVLPTNLLRFGQIATCKPASIWTSRCLQACFDLDKFTAYKHASIGQQCFLRTRTFDWEICLLRARDFDWAIASFELACFDHRLRLRPRLPSNQCASISLLPLTQSQISFSRLCCVQIFT